MYKSPERGRVKPRLARTIGEAGALELYRWMGRRQLDAIPGDWEVETRFSPDDREALVRNWLGPRSALCPQGAGDLGDRMQRAAQSCLGDGVRRKAVFLGADCLEIDVGLLKGVETALDRTDVVIGPALDGGYYLLGMKELVPALFEGIDWGGPSVFRETMNRIQSTGKSVTQLEARRDVDDWESLAQSREQVDPALWKRLGLSD